MWSERNEQTMNRKQQYLRDTRETGQKDLKNTISTNEHIVIQFKRNGVILNRSQWKNKCI